MVILEQINDYRTLMDTSENEYGSSLNKPGMAQVGAISKAQK